MAEPSIRTLRSGEFWPIRIFPIGAFLDGLELGEGEKEKAGASTDYPRKEKQRNVTERGVT